MTNKDKKSEGDKFFRKSIHKKLEESPEPILSHHDLPRKPGSDNNHKEEKKIDADRRRVWKEQHTPKPPRNK